ncbi:MAG: ComF family protein [Anaerolineae bacterium]
MGAHQGILRRAVHALKYDGLRVLAQPMGRLMAVAWRERRLQADYIVPVPLHSRRMRDRGYNQSWLLASVLAAEVGVAAAGRALARMRDTPAQISLSAQERRANVSGAFLADSVLSGKRIVLLDDVCTSGATLLACAAAIEAVNGSAVAAITFTRALQLEPDL